MTSQGSRLRGRIQGTEILPVIGIYDVFSASLAARQFDALFVSSFGFAASHYGLPDIGFVTWTDIVDFVRRLVSIVPQSHLIVDIDNGFCDTAVACHVATLLEEDGSLASALGRHATLKSCNEILYQNLRPAPQRNH